MMFGHIATHSDKIIHRQVQAMTIDLLADYLDVLH
jgi:hypothetical protein